MKKSTGIKMIMVKDAGIEPMPPFTTIQEEAEFWDTHSVVDEINEGTYVGFHHANKSDKVTVRFAPKQLQALREKAFQMGIGPTTLIRMWVLERLNA